MEITPALISEHIRSGHHDRVHWLTTALLTSSSVPTARHLYAALPAHLTCSWSVFHQGLAQARLVVRRLRTTSVRTLEASTEHVWEELIERAVADGRWETARRVLRDRALLMGLWPDGAQSGDGERLELVDQALLRWQPEWGPDPDIQEEPDGPHTENPRPEDPPDGDPDEAGRGGHEA